MAAATAVYGRLSCRCPAGEIVLHATKPQYRRYSLLANALERSADAQSTTATGPDRALLVDELFTKSSPTRIRSMTYATDARRLLVCCRH